MQHEPRRRLADGDARRGRETCARSCAPTTCSPAAWSPRDGHCTPESVVLGYAAGARRLGATVRTGVEVTGIETTAGAVCAVVTTHGTVRTATVVCAAGAWSAPSGAMAGVALPVTPYRRQILFTEPVAGPAPRTCR